MKALRVVLDVVRDLVVGDDWRMAVGIVAMVLLIVGGRAAGLPVWWLPPVTVLVMLGVGVSSAPPQLRRHRRRDQRR